MTIPLTKRDTEIIQAAMSYSSNAVRLIRYGGRGYEIAALRYFGELLNADGLGRSGRGDLPAVRITLCKLVENYPDQQDSFLVLKDCMEFMRDSRISGLVRAYSKTQSLSGTGSWSIPTHEQIVSSLYHLNSMNISTVILSTVDLRAMLTAYTRQAAMAGPPVTASARKSVREMVSQELLDSPTTSAERRQTAQDAAGRCYVCASPKPRQVPCLVCGYTPRGTK